MKSLKLREFSIRFLLAAQCFMPQVAHQLIRECREDIEIFGLEYAQKKWAKFVDNKVMRSNNSFSQRPHCEKPSMRRAVARGRVFPQSCSTDRPNFSQRTARGNREAFGRKFGGLPDESRMKYRDVTEKPLQVRWSNG